MTEIAVIESIYDRKMRERTTKRAAYYEMIKNGEMTIDHYLGQIIGYRQEHIEVLREPYVEAIFATENSITDQENE